MEERAFERMCEVVRFDDLGRLYDVKRSLEERGVYAEVREDLFGRRLRIRDRVVPRLVVRERDLVYARWVAYAAGFDPWPDTDDPRSSADSRSRDAAGRGRRSVPESRSPARPARAGR